MTTEPWNHGIVGSQMGWVGRNLADHLVPPSCHGPPLDQVVQVMFRDWKRKIPKSPLQERIGGQGTLPAWGHCWKWGLSAPSLQGWREWLRAVVAPGIRAVPKCLSRALGLFPGSEDGE